MRGKSHCTIGILASIQTCIFLNIPISFFIIIISAFFSLLPDLDEANSTISNLFMIKNISKKTLKNIVYTLIFLIFLILINLNKNIFVGCLFLIFLVVFFESKFNQNNLKKIFLSFIFILISAIFYILTSNIYVCLFWLFVSTFPWLKHRGFSHSTLAIASIYVLTKQIELSFNINYFSLFATISYSSHIFLGDIFTKNGVSIFYPFTQKKISLTPYAVGSKKCNFLEYFFILVFIILIFISIWSLQKYNIN